jgi:hypothetical protein
VKIILQLQKKEFKKYVELLSQQEPTKEDLKEALIQNKSKVKELSERCDALVDEQNQMRFKYLKELESLRELIYREQELPDKFDYLEVRYFQATDCI